MPLEDERGDVARLLRRLRPSSSGGLQLGDAEQVVRGTYEEGGHRGPGLPDEPRLLNPAHRLHPASHFFNQLPLALADRVAGRRRGSKDRNSDPAP